MYNRLAKLREERARGEHGFTLIELLVVVVIIGILIAIAIPLYLNYKKGANDKSAQSDLRGAVSVLEQCNADNSGYPSSLGTASGNSYNAMAGCANQVVNFTKNTTLTYSAFAADHTTACATAPCATYSLTATNSGGSGKTYSYDSWVGGSVN